MKHKTIKTHDYGDRWDEDDVDLLVHMWWNGKPTKEIAEALGRTEGAVRGRLSIENGRNLLPEIEHKHFPVITSPKHFDSQVIFRHDNVEIIMDFTADNMCEKLDRLGKLVRIIFEKKET